MFLAWMNELPCALCDLPQTTLKSECEPGGEALLTVAHLLPSSSPGQGQRAASCRAHLDWLRTEPREELQPHHCAPSKLNN